MGMSITNKKQITVSNDAHLQVLDGIYHKDDVLITIKIQEHTEPISSIIVSEDEARELGKWLMKRADEIRERQ